MTAYMDHKDLANENIDEARAREIADNTKRILDGIAESEFRAGRDAGSVTLLAATKTRDVREIMAAIDAGVQLIGENRPQEVIAKIDGLRFLCEQRGYVLGVHDMDDAIDHEGLHDAMDNRVIPFHLIGQLQSNKIGKMMPYINTVESVDSLGLAAKIGHRAQMRDIVTGVLLEVNESGESTKSGCPPEEAYDLACQVAEIEGLELQGLMTVGAHVEDEREIRRGFAHLRELRDRILASGENGTVHCTELSMGMTGDYQLAIEEGSTIVRIGSGIFGAREFV